MDGMTDTAALEAARRVVQLYLDGLYEGDGAKIAAAFHPCAHLYSVAEDGAVTDLPREEWLARIAARPSPASQGLARHDRVLALDLAGPESACAKVQCAIPPRFFTDYLLLLNTAEGWRIVAKSFRTEIR